jgi:hypothetical protein
MIVNSAVGKDRKIANPSVPKQISLDIEVKVSVQVKAITSMDARRTQPMTCAGRRQKEDYERSRAKSPALKRWISSVPFRHTRMECSFMRQKERTSSAINSKLTEGGIADELLSLSGVKLADGKKRVSMAFEQFESDGPQKRCLAGRLADEFCNSLLYIAGKLPGKEHIDVAVDSFEACRSRLNTKATFLSATGRALGSRCN